MNIPTPDFRNYPLQPALARVEAEEQWLRVRWEDGVEGRFHYVWLRDNAADDWAIDPQSHERIFQFQELPDDLAPARVTVDHRGALVVSWRADGRQSSYHPGWLRTYCYDRGARTAAQPEYETWDGGYDLGLATFSAGDVASDPVIRLQWLERLQRCGLTLITGAPGDNDAYRNWLESLLIVRDMNWGKYFDVIYEEDGAYISNKGLPIAPHQDGPTREHMPGLQIFRCLENTVEGGNSFWVDGFHIAARMKRDDPDDFALLSTVSWEHANRNQGTEYHFNSPLFRLDAQGAIYEVRDTYWLREPLRCDFDLVGPMYRA